MNNMMTPEIAATYAQGPAEGAEAAADEAHMAAYERAAAAHPTLPPVACQPWCKYQNGHPGQRFAEDQFCVSSELRTPLSRYPSVAMPGGPFEQEWLSVYAVRIPGEDVHMQIGRGDTLPIEVTPDEARQIIENMHLVLGQIGGAR